jgi:hypothetical protein
MATIQDLQRVYTDELDIFDEEEEDRFEKIKMYALMEAMESGYVLMAIQSQSKRERCTKEKADGRRYEYIGLYTARANTAQ